MLRKIIMRLAIVLLAFAGLAVPVNAQAAVAKGEVLYQQWLDQTAVTTSVNGVVTTYTERQVGMPAYQAVKHQQFVGGAVAQTVFWTCPSGIGCLWPDINGGGSWRQNVPFGSFYGSCWELSSDLQNNKVSSMSADYGGGYGLKLYDTVACFGGTWAIVWPSHAVNFTGALAYMNDIGSSYRIVDP